MGTYYYVKDLSSKNEMVPIYEDDYIAAILRIAKKYGVEITDKMIAEEINERWKSPSIKKSSEMKSKISSQKWNSHHLNLNVTAPSMNFMLLVARGYGEKRI